MLSGTLVDRDTLLCYPWTISVSSRSWTVGTLNISLQGRIQMTDMRMKSLFTCCRIIALEMMRPLRLGGGSQEACTDGQSQLGKAEAKVVQEKRGRGDSRDALTQVLGVSGLA